MTLDEAKRHVGRRIDYRHEGRRYVATIEEAFIGRFGVPAWKVRFLVGRSGRSAPGRAVYEEVVAAQHQPYDL
jgi:hypothetical protein